MVLTLLEEVGIGRERQEDDLEGELEEEVHQTESQHRLQVPPRVP